MSTSHEKIQTVIKSNTILKNRLHQLKTITEVRDLTPDERQYQKALEAAIKHGDDITREYFNKLNGFTNE